MSHNVFGSAQAESLGVRGLILDVSRHFAPLFSLSDQQSTVEVARDRPIG